MKAINTGSLILALFTHREGTCKCWWVFSFGQLTRNTHLLAYFSRWRGQVKEKSERSKRSGRNKSHLHSKDWPILSSDPFYPAGRQFKGHAATALTFTFTFKSMCLGPRYLAGFPAATAVCIFNKRPNRHTQTYKLTHTFAFVIHLSSVGWFYCFTRGSVGVLIELPVNDNYYTSALTPS